MGNKSINLTEAEWSVMECLWEASPLTGREVTELMARRCGWSRSTTLTLLSRLEGKGAVAVTGDSGKKTFAPSVLREDAAHRETEDFLGRVYKGSLSMMVSSLTQKQPLSQREIDELYEILEGLEAKKDE